MKFESDKDSSLLEFIKEKLKFSSNSKARNLIKSGAVKIDGQVVRFPSSDVKINQLITIDSQVANKRTSDKSPKSNFEPIFEDDYFIAYIKPPGLLSVSTRNKSKKEKNFYDLILKQYQFNNKAKDILLPVNRVDRKYSGIMLFAKSIKAELEIRKDWENNKKRYYALVEGVPNNDKGSIESHLKQNRIGRVYSAPKSEYGKLCSLNYRIMQKSDKYSLLKIDVISERKNSISAQLSENKMPIAGDKDYKGKPSPIKRFGLHLFSLKFHHPFEDKEIEIKTPIPTAFKQFFKRKPIKQK
jgi:23S rRNA-/tRNA-specific pseudouridylate synthase